MKSRKLIPAIMILSVRLLCLGASLTCLAAERYVPADYATIQAAVNASQSGDTIRIAAGDYYEQVVIVDKPNLTLVGESNTVLHATVTMEETLRPHGGWLWFPVIGILRSDTVISGLTFEGEHFGDFYSNLIGIYYLGSGGHVENCTIRGFRGPTLTEYTRANGLHAFNAVNTGAPAVTLTISNGTFADNEVSISLRGDPVNNPALPRTTIAIERNTIRGFGPAAIAIDGVTIRNGVTGTVRGNTITDHNYTGIGDPFSSGIAASDGRASLRVPFAFVPLLPIRYEGNTFSNNDEHLVLVVANDSQVVNNVFHGSGPDQPRWGGLAISGTNITVANNNFSDMPTGIVLFGNDFWFPGWPTVGIATNPKLIGNWFCNVPEIIRISPLVTGLIEQGTETECPFTPRFQSITSTSPGDVRTVLRGWHGESLVIEASSNLVDWVPAHTNLMALPTFEYLETNGNETAQRFYRAHRP